MPSLAEIDYVMMRPNRYVPAVRQLGGGTLVARGEAQPFRITGNDAVVYRLENPGFGAIALRCFLDDDLAEQTDEIYREFTRPATMRRLLAVEHAPFFQRMAWFPDGIVLRSDQLRSFSAPVLATEWIEGPTLFRAADHSARSRNSQALESLAEGWRRAIAAMGQARFVHGSLSADNALVDLHRGIVLVDYDYSWWPGLSEPRVASQFLVHHRHKRGMTGTPWEADAFASLVIYVSLRALAERPALRDRYGQPPVVRDGTLLFDQRDLDSPKRSELFRELDHIGSVEVRALAALLRQAAQDEPARTPTIEEAVAASAAARKELIRRNQPHPRPDEAPSPSLAASEPAVETRSQPARPREATPAMRAALDRAIASGDAATVTRLWPVLASDAESSWQALAANDLMYRFVRASVDETVATGSSQDVIDAVAASRSLGIPTSAAAIRTERQARLAKRLREQVEAAIAADDRGLLADLGTISEILPLGEEDTEIKSTMERASQLRTLNEAVAGDDDEQILRSVAPALLSTPDYLEAGLLARVQLARSRMRWKEEVRHALRKRDGLRLGALMEIAPPGAQEKLTPTERRRIERAIDQVTALGKLSLAMDTGNDRQLVDALNDVESSGAILPPDLDWSGISSVIDRLSLVTSIRRAAMSEPRDYLRLGRLLPAAREAYGGQAPYLGANFDVEALEWEVQRDTHRRRLLEAIATGNETAIAHAASPDPYGVVADLPEQDRQRVEAILHSRQKANPLG